MHSAIALVTTIAFLSSACAPPAAPARDAASAPSSASTPAARPPVAYAASETEPAPEPTPATQKVPDDARGSEATPRMLGWFSVGVGVASGIVAVGTSIMMLSQQSTRNSDCNAAKQCSAAGLTANNQIQSLGGWNAASYVVAAAGLGIGAFLLITNPANAEKQTAIGVAPTDSGAGLMLRSTF